MILLITVQQPYLDSPIDERFGRAAWFLLVDTETMAWQALKNNAQNDRGGAGVAAAQYAKDQNVQMVISGDFGPNGTTALQAAGIQMARFPKDAQTGNEVLKMFTQGLLASNH